MKEHEERVEEAAMEEIEKEVATASGEEGQSETVVDHAEQIEDEASEVLEAEESAEVLSGENASNEDPIDQIDNLKKHDAAVLLIAKTKSMVDDTEKQLDECKLLLQEDLKRYDEAKASLKEHALKESEALLEELGYDKEEDVHEEDDVVFEPKDEIPSFYVREVSKGKFTSSLLALIGGIVTFAGLAYFAAQKVGVPLDITKVPNHEAVTKVFGWYATLFGGKPDLFMGGAFVLIATLFVMVLIYGIRVASRASRNLAFAKQQMEEAQEYAKHKGSCKEEMDKVDAHMNEAIKVLKTYEVVLQEQNGKLKRILHIEGVQETPSKYHEKSQRELKDTDMLINAIKKFTGISMSEEGKLSGKSTLFLHSAKSKLQKFLDRHY